MLTGLAMHRDRLNDLKIWRKDRYRKPLILRGCRQVGKSWLIDQFGKEFNTFIKINFEKDKLVHQYFSTDLNVKNIVEKLAILANTKIEPGNTLLFFDEIQFCEGAIQSLRYFKEELPELHVIAAGSLLDFALNKLGIPVGRVQFLQLYPLSFSEYLTALGNEEIRHFLLKGENDPIIHQQALEHLKNYMWLGGMPAVVDAWIQDKDPVICQRIQDEIIESYQIDFHKYTKTLELPHVTKVFQQIPVMLGNKFIYSRIDSDSRSEVIKNALLLLDTAGIAKRCFHTCAQQLPLGAEYDHKKFKVFYFDIGIAQRILGLDIRQWLLNPFQLANKGEIAEQFVAQEIIAYSDFHKEPHLYYWHREAKNSNAEVDFVIAKNGNIIPVEVKSSQKGSMKSLQLFLESHPHSKYGLKISEGFFAKQKNLIEIPLYGLEGWFARDSTIS